MSAKKAVDEAMAKLYGKRGPHEDVDVPAIRAILLEVYNKGQTDRH